jgi:hypothetical protein
MYILHNGYAHERKQQTETTVYIFFKDCTFGSTNTQEAFQVKAAG